MTPGAIEQLAAAGFEDTVFDEAIVTEQPGVPVLSRFGRRALLRKTILCENGPNLIPKPDRRTMVDAFKAQLEHYNLSHDVINGHATALIHDGKFILVKTDPERADQAMTIPRNCNATRIVRHD